MAFYGVFFSSLYNSTSPRFGPVLGPPAWPARFDVGSAKMEGVMKKQIFALLDESLRELEPTAIWGVALCTDDDGGSLYVSVALHEDLVSIEPSEWFFPTEWPYRDELQAGFVEFSRTLFDNDSIDVVDVFEWSMWALALAGQGLGDGVYLSVLSTDPCEETEALEERAVRHLNTPHILTQRQAALDSV